MVQKLANESGYEFCDTPFWDLNLTWHTSSPNLTACFKQTLLPLLPLVILLVFVSYDLKFVVAKCSGRRRKLPFKWRNTAYLILNLIMIIVAGYEFFETLWKSFRDEIFILSNVLAPLLDLLGCITAVMLALFFRYRGRRISHSLTIFWLIYFAVSTTKLCLNRHLAAEHSSGHDDVVAYHFIPVLLSAVLFFVTLFADDANDFVAIDAHLDHDSCFMENKSLFARLTLSWVFDIVFKSLKMNIEEINLNRLCPDTTAEANIRAFEKADAIVNNRTAGSIHQKPSRLVPVIARVAFYPYLYSMLCEFVSIAMSFVEPLAIGWLLNMITNDEPHWHGVVYALALAVSVAGANIFNTHQFFNIITACCTSYSSIISAVYKKVLRLSPAARRRFTAGEITNFMSVDNDEVFDFLFLSSAIYTIPIRMVICIYLLWVQLGWASMMSFAVMAIIIPASVFVGSKCNANQERQMKFKDKRTEQISEILNGIRVLKLYAWEKPFMEQVTETRTKELLSLKYMAYWDSGFGFLWSVAPSILAFACFATYSLTSSTGLDAQKIFVSLSVFELIRYPMGLLPEILTKLIRARVSVNRLCEFFDAEELDPLAVGHDVEDPDSAIEIKKGTFTWERDSEVPHLRNLNINVKKGSLTAVIGQVGCGKSSIFSAILGDMYKLEGRVDTDGSIAYVPQAAWIQNETLRDNILFKSQYDALRYEAIIDSCALQPDLDMLIAKDMTVIGENGVNLSGGQKQRVNLARAVYENADVYLLDDPLSAVDAHVAKHLFDEVIGPKGLLKNKTRLLATHHVAFLKSVDWIVVVKDGEVAAQGEYDDLSSRGFMNELKLERQSSVESEAHMSPGKLARTNSVDKRKVVSLMDNEDYSIGHVKWKHYFNYVKGMGFGYFCLTAVVQFMNNFLQVVTAVWLSLWSEDTDESYMPVRLGVYLALIVGTTFFNIFGFISIFLGSLKASTKIHADMLLSVLRAPLRFFDSTPIGRILNRFSRDINYIDTNIPYNMMFTLGVMAYRPMVFGILIYFSWYLTFGIIVVVLFYYGFYQLYTWASRHLKRLESKNRSPVFSNFTETISGSTVIRAYQSLDHFMERSNERVNVYMNCQYHQLATNRWLEIWLVVSGSLILLATSLLIVTYRDVISAGLAGLVLVYAIDSVEGVTWGVRVFSDLETNMVAVERVREYSEQIDAEADWHVEGSHPSDWPSSGRVEFVDYATRYRKELRPCLRDVNIVVEPGERVGIVGRTGAGKSSLALSLFRIIEPTNGTIVIDGIDIKNLGVHDLRSRLTIIPQDPVLFSGTLRMNIDPWMEHEDSDLWNALELAHLKDYFVGQPLQLMHEISEGGDNLSAGQKQLVCLARALLRQTKVLMLDEATASVDAETDGLIQATIRSNFVDCTIITIAHRLNTVIDYDRIIVLSDGRVTENDRPSVLLADETSTFRSMAKEAGIYTK